MTSKPPCTLSWTDSEWDSNLGPIPDLSEAFTEGRRYTLIGWDGNTPSCFHSYISSQSPHPAHRWSAISPEQRKTAVLTQGDCYTPPMKTQICYRTCTRQRCTLSPNSMSFSRCVVVSSTILPLQQHWNRTTQVRWEKHRNWGDVFLTVPVLPQYLRLSHYIFLNMRHWRASLLYYLKLTVIPVIITNCENRQQTQCNCEVATCFYCDSPFKSVFIWHRAWKLLLSHETP